MKNIKEKVLKVKFCNTCKRYSLGNSKHCYNCIQNNKKEDLVIIDLIPLTEVGKVIDEFDFGKYLESDEDLDERYYGIDSTKMLKELKQKLGIK